MSAQPVSDFEQEATRRTGGNLVSEFWHFLRQNKKWWLLPMILVLLLFGALMLFSSTAAAPFIYTLF